MDPIEALLRVSYLSDRGRLDKRKSEAFLKAAKVLQALPPDELSQRIDNGTITFLPGIGPSTAAVIQQAAAGKTPDRIVALEAETQVPLGDGADLRARLQGDCHSHTEASDGSADLATMAAAAKAIGHHYLVITDHSPRLTVANGLSRDRLEAQLDQIAELNESFAGQDFQILTGIEVDILLDGSLDQDDDLLDRLDVVVASVHSKLTMERAAMTRRMIAAVKNPRVDILGHCTGRKVQDTAFGPRELRKQSTFDAEAVFAACADAGTAVEINSRPERQDPPDDLLQLAVEAGCEFSIDTDSHAPGQLEFVNYGADKAARHGISADRIITTRGADGLRAWTRGE
ncbi:PHP domain-containing protein [Nakamurella aerolata]|uniref:PHP domain-containing protein n=1 Tax=Nakamurella aerolata TaxID=1656892 RepID=A0A849A7J0_9ACTN|nr:PHP domain-containing protein [Nakamurella aerolata]NNG34460.1 PHP domain-containing protein [Nakamurella aerolata]